MERTKIREHRRNFLKCAGIGPFAEKPPKNRTFKDNRLLRTPSRRLLRVISTLIVFQQRGVTLNTPSRPSRLLYLLRTHEYCSTPQVLYLIELKRISKER